MKYLQEAGEFLKKREEGSSRKRIHIATVWGRLGVSGSHWGPLPPSPHPRAQDSHMSPSFHRDTCRLGSRSKWRFLLLEPHRPWPQPKDSPTDRTRTFQNKGRCRGHEKKPLCQPRRRAFVSRLSSPRRGLSLPTRPRASSPAAPAPLSLPGHPSPSQAAGQEASHESRVLPLRRRGRQAGATVPRGRLDRRALGEFVSTEEHGRGRLPGSPHLLAAPGLASCPAS